MFLGADSRGLKIRVSAVRFCPWPPSDQEVSSSGSALTVQYHRSRPIFLHRVWLAVASAGSSSERAITRATRAFLAIAAEPAVPRFNLGFPSWSPRYSAAARAALVRSEMAFRSACAITAVICTYSSFASGMSQARNFAPESCSVDALSQREGDSQTRSAIEKRRFFSTVSDRSLHEQIMEGVDDSDFRARSRRRMLELGVPREVVDRLYLDLPPIERPRTTE